MGCSDKISVVVKNVIETMIIQKDGWLQYFELVPHENGFVFRLKDYFGGEGEKPTEFIGWYMGADGWVENIADAYVIGEKGSTPEIGLNGNWFIDGVDTGLPSKGDSGLNKIADWIPEIVPQGEQRLHNGQMWEASVTTSEGEEPGISTKWTPKIDKATKEELETRNITNPYIIQGNLLWKPSTSSSTLYDVSKIVISARLDFTADFLKTDGTPRKIYIYSLSYTVSTSLLLINVYIEQENGSYTSPGVVSVTGTKLISVAFTEGVISFEIDTSRLISSINTPATYAQSGISENLISEAITRFKVPSLSSDVVGLLNAAKTSVPLTIANGYLNNSGMFVSAANWRASSNFTNVTAGETVWIEADTSIAGSAHALWGYLDGVPVNYLVYTVGFIEGGSPVKIPAGVNQIKGCSIASTPLKIYKLGGGDTTVSKRQMEKAWRAVGMSIWASDGGLKGYQTLVKELYDFAGYSKYCYSGNSLGGLTEADTSSILNKTGWIGEDDDIWTLDSNTNDFKRNIPIGTIADYNNNTGITTFYGALRVFKDKVLSLSPNATIMCSNALRRNNAAYTSTSTNTVGATLLDYEKAVMTVAALNGWYFVDQFRMSAITDETLPITTTDGLHLNNFGYTLAVLPWLVYFDIIYKNQFNEP